MDALLQRLGDGDLPLSVRGPYLHYAYVDAALTHLARPTRSRSAPAGGAVGQCAGIGPGPRLPRPQKNTRLELNQLSVHDLTAIAREYGLDQLCCQEDRQAADRALPRASGARRAPKLRASICVYLRRLSWDELIHLLRATARRRLREDQIGCPADSARQAAWEYFAYVCEALLRSQLRGDVGPSKAGLGVCEDSVTAWRMSRLCRELGLRSEWAEVLRRLSRGATVLLEAAPVPRLDDETRRVAQLVPRCRVLSATAPRGVLEQSVRDCDVLYVAGRHGRSLGARLRALRRGVLGGGTALAVLNVCRSGSLARHLLSQGVRNVVFWPSEVHDRAALEFGVALVSCLFEHSIVDAFAMARADVQPSERPPRLLRRRPQISRVPGGATSGFVLLEQRGRSCSGRPEHAGKRAKVLMHTAVNGWIKVNVEEGTLSWRVGHWRPLAVSEKPVAVKRRAWPVRTFAQGSTGIIASGTEDHGSRASRKSKTSDKDLVDEPIEPPRKRLRHTLHMRSLEIMGGRATPTKSNGSAKQVVASGEHHHGEALLRARPKLRRAFARECLVEEAIYEAAAGVMGFPWRLKNVRIGRKVTMLEFHA